MYVKTFSIIYFGLIGNANIHNHYNYIFCHKDKIRFVEFSGVTYITSCHQL